MSYVPASQRELSSPRAAVQSALGRAGELLAQVKRFDDQRPGVPGEHWFAFGTGAALLLRGRRAASPGWRAAAMRGGALFVLRAVSGRDGGLARLKRR